jgi:hypothetical protein
MTITIELWSDKTYLLTSSASRGHATAFDKLFTLPLNMVEYSEKLETISQRSRQVRIRETVLWVTSEVDLTSNGGS